MERQLAAATAGGQAEQDPVARLYDLRGANSRERGDLAERFESGIETYRKIQAAIDTKRAELNTIYEVETAAADPAVLIDAQRVKKTASGSAVPSTPLRSTLSSAPATAVNVSWPVGAPGDPRAGIFPFRVRNGTQHYDTLHKTLLPPALSVPEGFWATLDWPEAVRIGAELMSIPYSGQFDFVETRWVFPTAHMVAHIYLATSGPTLLSMVKAMITGWSEIPKSDKV